uniref:Uncharacterized protein n=1 Tax=Globodera rostochiensis TaxID=31243 RepID=A0A914HX38_GLORO
MPICVPPNLHTFRFYRRPERPKIRWGLLLCSVGKCHHHHSADDGLIKNFILHSFTPSPTIPKTSNPRPTKTDQQQPATRHSFIRSSSDQRDEQNNDGDENNKKKAYVCHSLYIVVSQSVMDKTNGNDSNFHQQQTGQFFHNNLSRYRFNHHPFLPSLAQQQMVLMMSSESEENSGGGGSGSATASVGSKTTDHQHRLQKQNSNTSSSNTTFVSSSSSNNTVYSSMFSSSRLLDDEDPVFSLDEEVLAKAQSGERTRHYTADFDPTVSDDDVDDLAKDAGKLHGGRAFSATHRFPPRTRHSGRSGIHAPAVVGIANLATAAPVGGHGHANHRTVVPASLPIAISRGAGAGVGGCGGFPSLERVVGSLSEEEESGGGCIAGGAGQTVPSPPQAVPPTTTAAGERLAKANKQPKTAIDHALVPYLLAGRAERKQRAGGSEREEGDLFGRIQAYSRSIQPADDPERLFGERPRRHQHNYNNNTKQQLENNSSVVEGENIPPPPSIAAAAAVGDFGVSRNNSDGRHGVCGGGVVVAAGNVTTTTAAGTSAAVMLDNNYGGGAGAGGMGAPATTTAVTTASAGGAAAAGGGARAVVGTPRIIVPTSLRAVW